MWNNSGLKVLTLTVDSLTYFRWRNTCRICTTRSLVRDSSTMSCEQLAWWSCQWRFNRLKSFPLQPHTEYATSPLPSHSLSTTVKKKKKSVFFHRKFSTFLVSIVVDFTKSLNEWLSCGLIVHIMYVRFLMNQLGLVRWLVMVQI